jgi:hypothetical protein
MHLAEKVLFHNVKHGCRRKCSDWWEQQDSQREEPENVLTNIGLYSSKLILLVHLG